MALTSDRSAGTDRAPEPSPWASPDARPRAAGTPFGSAPAPSAPGTPLWHDVRAGLLTVAVTVLLGAPVGLLWAAVAPRVTVEVTGEDVQVLDAYGDAFIAVDAWFLAAVVVAGLVGGVLTCLLSAGLEGDTGPGVVLGLVVGGLAAAWIAGRVGGEVDRMSASQLVESGVQGRREIAVQLRSTSALLGWPLASLLAFLAVSLARRPAASSD